jgi:hypothetical protein
MSTSAIRVIRAMNGPACLPHIRLIRGSAATKVWATCSVERFVALRKKARTFPTRIASSSRGRLRKFLSFVSTTQPRRPISFSHSSSLTPWRLLKWAWWTTTVAPASRRASGTRPVPRHSSINRTRSGGVECEFAADRFFDFGNRSAVFNGQELE